MRGGRTTERRSGGPRRATARAVGVFVMALVAVVAGVAPARAQVQPTTTSSPATSSPATSAPAPTTTLAPSPTTSSTTSTTTAPSTTSTTSTTLPTSPSTTSTSAVVLVQPQATTTTTTAATGPPTSVAGPPVTPPPQPATAVPQASPPVAGTRPAPGTRPAGAPLRRPVPLPAESLTAPGARELVRSLEDLVGRASRLRSAIADAEAAIGRLELEVVERRRQADAADETARRLRAELARFEAELHRLDSQRHAVTRHASPPPRTVPLVASGRQLLRTQEELAQRISAHGEQILAVDRSAQDAQRAVVVTVEDLERQRQGLTALREELGRVPNEMEVAAGLAAAAGAGDEGPKPSTLARADIPADHLERYRRAARTCPGLQWTVLAAIGSVESSHGRADLPGVRDGANSAGAMGPMQFLAETWSAYGKDGDGDGAADVYDPDDAVLGAANYLCASGAGEPNRLGAAIWAYNHADWYVAAVLARAAAYGTATLGSPPADAAALVANPNLTVTEEARADLLSGAVDPRVVAALAAAVEEHRIVVSVIKTGHSQFVRGTDRVSNHYHARAVDISSVDGMAVSASNQGALGLAVAFLTADASLRPDEFGSPWPDLASFPGAFSDADHSGHLHLGWR